MNSWKRPIHWNERRHLDLVKSSQTNRRGVKPSPFSQIKNQSCSSSSWRTLSFDDSASRRHYVACQSQESRVKSNKQYNDNDLAWAWKNQSEQQGLGLSDCRIVKLFNPTRHPKTFSSRIQSIHMQRLVTRTDRRLPDFATWVTWIRSINGCSVKKERKKERFLSVLSDPIRSFIIYIWSFGWSEKYLELNFAIVEIVVVVITWHIRVTASHRVGCDGCGPRPQQKLS